MGKTPKARTYGLRERRAVHRLRQEAAAVRRLAERAGPPSTSLAALRADQLNPTLTEEPS
jgi:hypothetical protein